MRLWWVSMSLFMELAGEEGKVVKYFQLQHLEINFYEKKLKKILKKKKISETINKAIPHRNPNSVMEVCNP